MILVIHGGSFMPAYCTTSSTFEIYCKWCVEHHQTPPTRDWWDNAVTQPRQFDRRLSDDELDDETEIRDGWAR